MKLANTQKPVIQLSNPQKNIIEFMRKGWQLRTHTDLDLGYWLRKGGNETKNVTESNFRFLVDKGLLDCVNDAPPMFMYNLSQLGKTIDI